MTTAFAPIGPVTRTDRLIALTDARDALLTLAKVELALDHPYQAGEYTEQAAALTQQIARELDGAPFRHPTWERWPHAVVMMGAAHVEKWVADGLRRGFSVKAERVTDMEGMWTLYAREG